MMDSSVDTCRVMLVAVAMVARKSRRKIMLKKEMGLDYWCSIMNFDKPLLIIG